MDSDILASSLLLLCFWFFLLISVVTFVHLITFLPSTFYTFHLFDLFYLFDLFFDPLLGGVLFLALMSLEIPTCMAPGAAYYTVSVCSKGSGKGEGGKEGSRRCQKFFRLFKMRFNIGMFFSRCLVRGTTKARGGSGRKRKRKRKETERNERKEGVGVGWWVMGDNWTNRIWDGRTWRIEKKTQTSSTDQIR